MKIQTFYPQHPALKKFIEYYYFLKTDTPDFRNIYYAFPNTLQSLNIHKNASCEIKPNFTKIYEHKNRKYLTVVQGYYDLPLLAHLEGRLDKMTIIFKPLGLHHFIKRSFKKVAGNHSQVFEEWEGETYEKFLDNFYETTNLHERIALLESFLLSQYQPFAESEDLQRVLNLLTDFESDWSIERIAAHQGVNVRTLNRLFDKHFGISPIAFKKIARFRHSLKNKLFDAQFKKLTEIGYESNFYDQSYFIKIYKNLTGKNPSKFFKSIDTLADGRLIFEFVNK